MCYLILLIYFCFSFFIVFLFDLFIYSFFFFFFVYLCFLIWIKYQKNVSKFFYKFFFSSSTASYSFWHAIISFSQQTFVVLEDVLKVSSRYVLKTSSKRLQCNNFSSSKTSWKTSWRRLEDVLKTSWKTKNCYAEDVFKTCLQDVFKTFTGNVLLGISASKKS